MKHQKHRLGCKHYFACHNSSHIHYRRTVRILSFVGTYLEFRGAYFVRLHLAACEQYVKVNKTYGPPQPANPA